MWLRTALLLVLALLAWKFLSGLVRSLTATSREVDPAPRGRPDTAVPPKPGAPRDWPPSDIVDVPFRDADDDRAASR
jgi:hypothetical protein